MFRSVTKNIVRKDDGTKLVSECFECDNFFLCYYSTNPLWKDVSCIIDIHIVHIYTIGIFLI